MTTPLFTDDDLAERFNDARSTIATMRDAILAAHHGRMLTPPRVHAPLGGDSRLTYTVGRRIGHWFGYRSYDTATGGDQIIVVQDDSTGEVLGMSVGRTLGHVRVGAIGGVACDALAPAQASTLGLIGTGPQAWMQLWAIHAVRPLTEVKVFSRTVERRQQFAANAAKRYGIDVIATGTPDSAVEGMDMVALATSSGEPVVDAAAITAEFVTTLGPKQVNRHEFPIELAERFPTIVTDSPPQVRDYDPPFMFSGTATGQRMTSLGSILDGQPASGAALFCSVGLAGTDTWLLADLIGR
ncbi:ornithine cyclodeaminase [Stackebrandtia endophytica]|uniref:Ornithine cyclodeaminase n=1 Tax=Stackebrandtia endophytica TaxID=1496996 RepID=A0A543B1I4_9ACTN|nr:ornithine cyclodeaminase family protein [Stackebrandtia endophytica]TQL78694.1 ornithine cyclodeaminase [Stackebrandtia endophytica]